MTRRSSRPDAASGRAVLRDLRIHGLGVIADAELELGPGLTVVTGETGAGKTMVITGLSLLAGGRADAGRVRSDAGRLVVEGRWAAPKDHPAIARAVAAGAELDDDDSLVVVRQVSDQGRSRAALGGVTVPLSVLAEVGSELVALHGQSDQRLLLGSVHQRQALDRYAGAEPLLEEYRATYRQWRSVVAEQARLQAEVTQRQAEAELLREQLGQIEAAGPEPGEDVARAAEAQRLAHAEELRAAAEVAHDALTGDEVADVVTLLGQARKQLALPREHDPELAGLDARLAELSVVAADIATDLASYAASIETDPARLRSIEERRAVLQGISKRHGGSIDAALNWAAAAAARLAELDSTDDRLAALSAQRAQLTASLRTAGRVLSAARTQAADTFSALVTAELAALAMPHAIVSVAVTQRDDPEGLALDDGRCVGFGADGVDEVELLLSAHTGAPLRPIAKAASGGELSRVMLAIEVVFAGADPTATFVFDEIDAGVGGAAALEVGRRLARLATSAQVVVVTHLAQVAAYADRHLVVRKSDDGAVTSSGLHSAEGTDRIAELARMLGGDAQSDTALAHAAELLERAEAQRGEP
jgi:DNA repair protein RecN (Recombination protein N)